MSKISTYLDYVNAVAQDESLDKHDKKYHGGHFDPDTMTCKKREKMIEGDESDKGDFNDEKAKIQKDREDKAKDDFTKALAQRFKDNESFKVIEWDYAGDQKAPGKYFGKDNGIGNILIIARVNAGFDGDENSVEAIAKDLTKSLQENGYPYGEVEGNKMHPESLTFNPGFWKDAEATENGGEWSLENVKDKYKKLTNSFAKAKKEMYAIQDKYSEGMPIEWSDIVNQHSDAKEADDKTIKAFREQRAYLAEMEKHGFHATNYPNGPEVVAVNLDWPKYKADDVAKVDSVHRKFSKILDKAENAEVAEKVAKVLTLLDKRYGFASAKYKGTDAWIEGNKRIPIDKFVVEHSQDKLDTNFEYGNGENSSSAVLNALLKEAVGDDASAWYNYKGWKEGHPNWFEIGIKQ